MTQPDNGPAPAAPSATLPPGVRPAHLRPPADLSPSPPVPRPEPIPPPSDPLDPTRYGDWERKGIAIDF